MTRWSESAEDEGRCDIGASRLTEDRSSGPRTAREGIVGWVVAAVMRLTQRAAPGEAEEVREATWAVGNATKLAAEAAAGRLEGASLEGDLKRAEIAEKFANARLLNAQAGVIEEQAARQRLERALLVAKFSGAAVTPVHLPDGTLALAVADQLLTSAMLDPSSSAESTEHERPQVPASADSGGKRR